MRNGLEVDVTPPNGTGKIKILIVENNISLMLMLVHVLSRVGFDVQAATKARRGLEIAQEERFDLIVLETELSDVDGFRICADLKQRHISYRTPIIFLSCQGNSESRRRAFELGAVDYIEKPFETDNFISCILSHVTEGAVT